MQRVFLASLAWWLVASFGTAAPAETVREEVPLSQFDVMSPAELHAAAVEVELRYLGPQEQWIRPLLLTSVVRPMDKNPWTIVVLTPDELHETIREVRRALDRYERTPRRGLPAQYLSISVSDATTSNDETPALRLDQEEARAFLAAVAEVVAGNTEARRALQQWGEATGLLSSAAAPDVATTTPPAAGPAPSEPATVDQPQFGFRMDRDTFQELRRLAPELATAHWPGLTAGGQQSWDRGEVATVYNSGYYLEDDVNGDGQDDAALLLSVPQPQGAEQQHLLLATRRMAGMPWARVGLVQLPSAPQERRIMEALAQIRTSQDPNVSAFWNAPQQMTESSAAPSPTRSISEWIVRLNDQDPRVRLEAAEALGGFGAGAEAAIEPLAQRLYDPEGLVRNAAVSSLAQIGPASVPALDVVIRREGATAGRHDPGGRAQRLAVEAIGRIAARHAESEGLVQRLSDILQDRALHDVVRHQVCLAVGQIGVNASPTIPALTAILRSTDDSDFLREATVYALVALGSDPRTITALEQSLHDDNVFIRRAAVSALGRFGPAAAATLPSLRAALSDPDAEVRASAERAMQQMAPSNPARE